MAWSGVTKMFLKTDILVWSTCSWNHRQHLKYVFSKLQMFLHIYLRTLPHPLQRLLFGYLEKIVSTITTAKGRDPDLILRVITHNLSLVLETIKCKSLREQTLCLVYCVLKKFWISNIICIQNRSALKLCLRFWQFFNFKTGFLENVAMPN